jgi:hypothetical protein
LNAQSMVSLAVASALCAFAMGCGDDDDSSSGGAPSDNPSITTSSLTKAQFIKQAGAACNKEREEVLQELSAYAERHKGVPRDRLIANAFKAVFVPVVEKEIAAIRQLGAPEGDEEEVAEILAAEQEGIDQIKQLERAKSAPEFGSYFQAADEKLKAYGLTGCTKG